MPIRSRRRRPGILPTIGVVVEGDTEYYALPEMHRQHLVARCPPMKLTNLGGLGGDKSAQGIAELVLPRVVTHLSAGRRRVVVLIDRERRSECAGELAMEVRRRLAARLPGQGFPADAVAVVTANRAFEAWLLAGATGLHAAGVFRRTPMFHSFEGELGAEAKLGTIELGWLLGRMYDKRRDGPKLFAQIDFPAARTWRAGGAGSRSLDKFLRVLGV